MTMLFSHPRRISVGALLFVFLVIAGVTPGWAQVRIAATTPTLGAIAAEIGGEHVEVDSLLNPGEDFHRARAGGAALTNLRRADFLIHTGLDAEPWLPDLLRRARNERIEPGEPGDIDASTGVALLDAPAATSPGQHSHQRGNPHYLLDPMNGIIVANAIAEALSEHEPALANEFRANAADFEERVRALRQEMSARLEPLAGAPVLVFHESWSYFFDRFKIDAAACVEPAPGAKVSAARAREVVEDLNMTPPAFMIVDAYTDRRIATLTTRLLNAPMVELITEVGAARGVETYEQLLRHNLEALLEVHEAWRGGMDQRRPHELQGVGENDPLR